jgi:type I restriction enzyme, S subunit
VSLTLKPYPEYKEPGLPWLGNVPAHWSVGRNGRIFAQRKEIGFPELPILEVSLKTGVRVRNLDNQMRKQIMDDRSKYKRAGAGDIAYNMMRLWQGAVGVAPVDGLVSPAYVVIKPNKRIDSRYYAYLFRTAAYMQEVNKYSHGIVSDRNRLYWEEFKQMPSLFPPHEEQQAIADYLDRQGALVSALIRRMRRTIELLNEQKQAMIQRAVTRGLDPNVHLKSSGIEWLPQMPKKWKKSRVKAEFSCLNTKRIPLSGTQRGLMTNRPYDYYGASGVIDKVDSYIFDDNLLLIAEDGANLVSRNLPLAIIARGRFWVNNHAHILKPKGGNLEYMGYLMECIDYRPWITGAAQPKLTQDRLMAVPIPIPPPEEQDKLVDAVRFETHHLCSAIENATSEVALLREYRTRLIADVITGKLDVRGASLPKLEVADESDAVNDWEGEELEDSKELEAVEENVDAD